MTYGYRLRRLPKLIGGERIQESSSARLAVAALRAIVLWLHAHVEIVEFGSLSDEQRAQLEGDEDDPFDSAGSTLRHRRKDRHVGLRDGQGRLVASTGMLIVDLEVARQRFAVVGFGGVIVNARHRGRGLAREVVQAALAKAQTLGPEFVILFCHEDRAGLYRKLGFADTGAEVMVRQPGGYAAMPQPTMWRALRTDAVWPPGPIVVHSLPF
jgi:predicted N-acetyltransferase YhbS